MFCRLYFIIYILFLSFLKVLFYLNITLSIKEFSSWFRDICVVLTFYMNLGRDYNILKSFSWLKSYLLCTE